MVYYKMNTQTIMCCVVALILGMLLANMLKNVCGCKNVVEGFGGGPPNMWELVWDCKVDGKC
jgi:hypothetical protein